MLRNDDEAIFRYARGWNAEDWRLNRKEPEDYSDQVQLSDSRLVRAVYLGLGFAFFAVGIVGIFLPILPTTPFVLLAAACFAKSSVRFYNWLLNNRYFGHYIWAWRNEKRIPLKAKITAVTLIVLTVGASIAFFVPVLIAKIILGAIALIVIAYILSFPS